MSNLYGSKLQKKIDDTQDENNWLVTYSDLMTLLLAFFVLIVSISTIDQQKVEQVSQSMEGALTGQAVETPFDSLDKELGSVVGSLDLESEVEVQKDALGVSIRFSSQSFFDSGSVEIKLDRKQVFMKIARTIMELDSLDYVVNVDGHTDDIPIRSAQFPSNWELSVGRAARVVRLFQNVGIPKEQLKASGFGDSRPIVPNRDENGNAIRENQAQNRRVDVYVHRKVK
jgi:chemotaxis protein MotB